MNERKTCKLTYSRGLETKARQQIVIQREEGDFQNTRVGYEIHQSSKRLAEGRSPAPSQYKMSTAKK